MTDENEVEYKEERETAKEKPESSKDGKERGDLPYKILFPILVKQAEKQGLHVKFVGNKVLHDYEAMNPEAAKAMGKPMPSNEIEIERGLPEEKKYRDLHHELIERGRMANGEKYWEAHVYSLEHEADLPKGVRIVKEHDDGDLTVNIDGDNYVLTTDGRAFRELKAEMPRERMPRMHTRMPRISRPMPPLR